MADENKPGTLSREFELAQSFDVDVKAVGTNLGVTALEGEGTSAVGVEEEEVNVTLMCETMPMEFRSTFASKLAWWYSWIGFRPIDTISVLGGDSLFLIHAESLILHFTLRHQIAGDLLDEFQSIRLFYTIEKLLQTIRDCQGVFRLVFFEASLPTFASYSSSPTLLAAREALLLYCKSTNVIPFVVFKSWESKEFKEFIIFWQPAFMLLEDGGGISRPDEIEQETPSDGLELIYSLMLTCLAEGLSVSLLYRLTRRGRKILAQTTFPDQAVMSLRDEIRGLGDETYDDWHRSIEVLSDRNTEIISLGHFGVRGLLIGQFAKNNLDGDFEPWLELFSKVMMVVDALSQELSIKERALVSVDTAAWQDTEAGAIWAASSQMFLHEMRPTLVLLVASGNVGDVAQIPDFVDFKLANVTLAALVSEGKRTGNWDFDESRLGLSSDGNCRIDRVWREVANQTENFFPIRVSRLSDQLGELPPLLTVPQEKGLSELMKIDNLFLSQFLSTKAPGCALPFTTITEDTKSQQQLLSNYTTKYPDEFTPGVMVDLAGMMLDRLKDKSANITFISPYHQKRMASMTPSQQEMFKQKILRKRQQREANRLRVMGQSLVGATRLHHPIAADRSRQHVWNTELPEMSDDESTAVASSTTSPIRVEKKIGKKPAKLGTKKGTGPSKKELIIQKNEEALKEKAGRHDVEHFTALERELSQLMARHQANANGMFVAILDLCVGVERVGNSFEDFPGLNNLLKIPETHLKFVLLVLSKLQVSVQKFYVAFVKKRNERDQIRRLVSMVLRLVCDIYRAHSSIIDGNAIKQLQAALITVGFSCAASNLFAKWRTQVNNRLQIEDPLVIQWSTVDKKSKKKMVDTSSVWDAYRVKKSDLADFHIRPGTEATFQLQFMGPDMERTLGSSKDPRVCFRPDRWQKKLLDCVDRRESALVVAPTASGKTFIGYYAMDLVLRLDDISCVAFVAPSKALAQQVFHECHARFGSKSYRSPSMVLVGELQQDTMREAMKCQILVTVPYALELLLSSEDRTFVERLKYLVLDEIHCISQDAGEHLEHLIQLAPCPFIALSATVGNPKSFHNWLDRVRCSSVRRVHEIIHEERYADLDMYVYSGSDNGRVLFPLNGFACVRYQNLIDVGFPKDLSLSSADCLVVYRTVDAVMSQLKVSSEWSKVGADALDRLVRQLEPEMFFMANIQSSGITKAEYRRYWKELSEAIRTLAIEGILTEDLFNSMVVNLQNPPSLDAAPEIFWDEKSLDKLKETVQPSSKSTTTLMNVLDSTTTKKEYLEASEFAQFVQYMSKRGLLPALVFNFSRLEMRVILARVVKKLLDDNYNVYHRTEEASHQTKLLNKKRQDDYKVLLREREMAQKMRNMSREQRLAQGLADDAADTSLDEPLPPPPVNIEDEFDERFNFANRQVLGAHGEDIKKMIDDLDNESPDLVEGLKRGIAIHHEALSTGYRRAVEVLFRMGYLRIVLTATSLSLGVNMPCKSSVFAGNFVDLTPLMFRQTSGRAGRRGCDNLGYIVFWNLPFSKIQRLIGSQLSVLSGEFPVNPTAVLRTLQLQEELSRQIALETKVTKKQTLVEDHRRTTEALIRMYTIPLFSVSSRDHKPTDDEISKIVVMAKYCVRFAVDLLQRRCLIDANGELDGLCSLVLALFDRQPANVAFQDLVLSGSLQETVGSSEADLLHILAYLFHTVPVTYSTVKRIQFGGFTPDAQNPFRPLLPPLPSQVSKEIENFNRRILENAVSYVRAMAAYSALSNSTDCVLPFSLIDFTRPVHGVTPGTVREVVMSQLVPASSRHARSPFAAVCGRSDSEFLSVEDLVWSIRSDVYIEPQMVPVIEYDVTSIGGKDQIPLVNSYLLDFVREKSLKGIIRGNSIDSYRAWYLIHDWRMSIGAVCRIAATRKSAKATDKDLSLCGIFSKLAADIDNLANSIGA